MLKNYKADVMSRLFNYVRRIADNEFSLDDVEIIIRVKSLHSVAVRTEDASNLTELFFSLLIIKIFLTFTF